MAKKTKKKAVKKAAKKKPAVEEETQPEPTDADLQDIEVATSSDTDTYTNCRNCGEIQHIDLFTRCGGCNIAGCPDCSQPSVSNCPHCGFKR